MPRATTTGRLAPANVVGVDLRSGCHVGRGQRRLDSTPRGVLRLLVAQIPTRLIRTARSIHPFGERLLQVEAEIGSGGGDWSVHDL